MALADQLKSLQELHDTGKLTDAEYVDAKAATLNRGTFLMPGRTISPITAMVIGMVLLGGLVWYLLGGRKAGQLIATAVHAPMTLTDEVENLPAHSAKILEIDVPYNGTLTLDIATLRGNPIDIFVAASDQLSAVRKGDWDEVKTSGDFTATKSTTYKRSSQLAEGAYYLVLRDKSLGILSSPATDISVKAKLTP